MFIGWAVSLFARPGCSSLLVLSNINVKNDLDEDNGIIFATLNKFLTVIGVRNFKKFIVFY